MPAEHLQIGGMLFLFFAKCVIILNIKNKKSRFVSSQEVQTYLKEKMLKTKINFLAGKISNKMTIAIGAAIVLVAILAIGVLVAYWKIEKMERMIYANTNINACGNSPNLYRPNSNEVSASGATAAANYKKDGKRFSRFGNIFSTNGYSGQNMRDNIWLILAIKSIFLITLLAILVVIIKRLIKNLRNKKNKPSVNIVKQATKIRPRAIKKAKRK